MRIGQGYDVHGLVEGRNLIIGGVEIEFEKGLEGHSDADVLTHAIMDALLGAAGLDDIGHHFPPSDMSFKDADSISLLRQVVELVHNAGYSKILNIDATLVAERPKVGPYIGQMKGILADAMGIETGLIGIKATTSEGMGFTGRGEGMAAMVVCLIE